MNFSSAGEMRSPLFAYVGSRTTRERNARGEGISVFRVDPVEGSLELLQVVGDLVNPSFLALDPQRARLYCVHGDGHEVSVFGVDRAAGTLRFMQRQECGGRNPVHLALDPTGRFLVVSDHLGSERGGSLVVLPVRDDGTLGEVSQRLALQGEPGPHRVEQLFARPHFNPFDPGGRFVVVPDKGLDKVFVFRLADGVLVPAAMPSVDAREGAGPRHVAFHPHAPYAYVVNELDSTVTSYRFDAATGALQAFQVLSSLPDTYVGNSRASEIEVSADGSTLYASNRGHDSIAVYRIDEASGRLEFLEAVPAQGRTPRFFALLPDGRFLFVLNEESDSLVGFAVDSRSGRLTPSGRVVRCGSPVCMIFSD